MDWNSSVVLEADARDFPGPRPAPYPLLPTTFTEFNVPLHSVHPIHPHPGLLVKGKSYSGATFDHLTHSVVLIWSLVPLDFTYRGSTIFLRLDVDPFESLSAEPRH